MQKVSLVLEDGSQFEGYSFGAERSVSGEVVFATGMVGYNESLTDPSYRGQILVFTYPLIGNYGVPPLKADTTLPPFFESDRIHVSGLVVSDYSSSHNHWNADRSLADWLRQENVPALQGIDTRELTRRLREKGTMLGKIVNGDDLGFYDPGPDHLVRLVSTERRIVYNEGGHPGIVLIDCGTKYNIIRSFLRRDCRVVRVPYDYDFFEESFDGVCVSNGPGDPKQCPETVALVRRCLEEKIPTFGICLGNQIMALAAGADTYKLAYGHRSQNQPCLRTGTKRCFITAQNHGYAVRENSLPGDWESWFVNANDGTNEGIRHLQGLFSSVQFHPEHAPGPVDTEFLFDEFIGMVAP
jgi:carbamoyl-phosphate synthase small subunit